MAEVRNDWTRGEIAALFDLPFTELLFRIQHGLLDRRHIFERSTLGHVHVFEFLWEHFDPWRV